MTRASKRRWFAYSLRTLFVVVTVAAACLAGCADSNANRPANQRAVQQDSNEQRTQANSADCLLGPDDYDKFSPGRSQTEVLTDLQWRGNFEFATNRDGKDLAAISYGLFGGPLGDHGTSVLAIFVNGNFEKFVRWPKGDTQLRIGDFSILRRATESEPVDILELEKDAGAKFAVPKQINPSLAITWLRFRDDVQAARAPMFKKNAAMRDQFNAARLKLGMRASEVEALFRSKPIRSGGVDAGSFEIYGSTEAFDITPDLHYSNVLVVLRDGKVTGIYSGGLVPGGDGLQRMQEWFVDLRDPK